MREGWWRLFTKAKQEMQEMQETETKMDSESESKAHPDSGYPDWAKFGESETHRDCGWDRLMANLV